MRFEKYVNIYRIKSPHSWSNITTQQQTFTTILRIDNLYEYEHPNISTSQGINKHYKYIHQIIIIRSIEAFILVNSLMHATWKTLTDASGWFKKS